MHFIDTNVLLRFLTPGDPFYPMIRQALIGLRTKGERLCTSPQNIAEFWNVCTRPQTSRGGYGLTVTETARRLKIIERFIIILSEPDDIYSEWKTLILTHSVAGVQVYDTRIVAAMIVHGVNNIITINISDFTRYPKINAIHPKDVR
jgi:predicted nucleic acid-binding protein